jgi:hypothetical protein
LFGHQIKVGLVSLVGDRETYYMNFILDRGKWLIYCEHNLGLLIGLTDSKQFGVLYQILVLGLNADSDTRFVKDL